MRSKRTKPTGNRRSTRPSSSKASAARAPKKKKSAPVPTRLTGAQKRYLRALAHPLDAVIQVGHKGITESVIKEIGEALRAHELIKVKLGRHSPSELGEAAEEIAKSTRALVAQTIGRVIVIYRPAADPDDRKIELPRPRRAREDAHEDEDFAEAE